MKPAEFQLEYHDAEKVAKIEAAEGEFGVLCADIDEKSSTRDFENLEAARAFVDEKLDGASWVLIRRYDFVAVTGDDDPHSKYWNFDESLFCDSSEPVWEVES